MSLDQNQDLIQNQTEDTKLVNRNKNKKKNRNLPTKSKEGLSREHKIKIQPRV